MIDRRQFGIGLAALGCGLATTARADGVKVMKLANTAVVNDPQQAFITVGQHPKLNYYRAAGVDVEYVNMSSIAQAMQAMSTGQVAFGPAAPGIFLPALAKDPSIGLVSVYEWLPRNGNVIVVKPESAIKSAADLPGLRIGVRNQGDPGIVVTKTMLLELGLDDSKCEYIAIGDGATAGAAIDQGRVDAIVTYDTAAARIELVGTKLRYLPLPPKFDKLGSSWLCVRKEALKSDRKALVGVFRGIAKSTLFAYNNLDQAINIHWALYPESKPKGKTEDEARKELHYILQRRMQNWMRRPDDPDQRMGAQTAAEWKTNIDIAAATSKNPQLAAQLGNPGNVFSNELIDEVNAFDKAAVIQQAKSFKL
jgi:NitT/TauT family transport system substrate-binding protein